MKNRIISMLLVVVSCVLLLTGCAFNYQKKDLTSYAEFNLDAFKELLKHVEVEEGEFAYGNDEARAKMVADEVYARLVKLADPEDKVTEGTLAEKDILYYCYYVVATFETTTGEGENKETKTETYAFYTTNMTESKFQSLALYDLEKDVDKKIMEAVLGDTALEFVKDKTAYTTTTEGATEGGKVVYVSYKETKGTTTTTYTNKKVVLPVLTELAEGETFEPSTLNEYLVGKEMGSGKVDDLTLGEGTEDAVKYSNIVINWQVNTGDEIVVSFEKNPFTTSTKQKADNGVEQYLNTAKTIEYHIFPVGRYEAKKLNLTEATGKLVFTTLLGDGISTTSLEVLGKTDYKYTDDTDPENVKEYTMKGLVEELAGKYKALSDAKTAYDKSPTNTTLKETYETAKAAVAEDKLNEYWDKMQKCMPTDDEGVPESLASVLYTQYTDDVYDELEEDYSAEIQDKVVVALWALIQENVKNVKAPKKAVKDAYKQNLEAYKYKYYTGKVNDSTDTNAATNLETYKTFKQYLIAEAKKIATNELGVKDATCDTYAQAEDIMTQYAEKQVKEHIIIWTVAKAFDIDVADTEIENFALLQSYYMQIYGYSITSDQILDQYGKENIRTYLAFDKLIGYFIEVEEDNKDTDEDESLGGIAYKNISSDRVPAEDEDTNGDAGEGEEEVPTPGTGNGNTGDENTGDENTGDENTGDETTGDETTGDETTGNE